MIATASCKLERVSELFECSLCLCIFKKPKCLSCLHTFCFDCLQNYVDQNKDRAELPCPLCRETFFIPPQGLNSLRDNFFIQSMMEVDDKCELDALTASESLVVPKCDECLEEKDESGYPSATNYCIECEQNFCDSCTSYHRRRKGYRSHKIVPITEKSQAIKDLVRNTLKNCDKHENDPLRLYCIDCDVVVCVVCMLSEHNGHHFEDIKQASSRYRDKINTSFLTLKETLLIGQTSTEKLKLMESGVVEEIGSIVKCIKERCAELRSIIDQHEQQLLNEVQRFQTERIKEIKVQLDEVEFQNVMLQNFTKYLEEIKERGSDFDVAYSGKELLSRNEHLQTSSTFVYGRELKVTHVDFLTNIGEGIDRTQVGKVIYGEKYLITIGLDIGDTVEQKICCISLDNHDTITVIDSTPAEIHWESAACVINNILYAVGIGGSRKELWAWSADRGEWMRCTDMTSGRCRHCVTSVGDKVYVLGGWVDAGRRTLDSILCYDINSNTWTEPGQLCHAVESATCVSYKHCIYVFGGSSKGNKSVNHVQVYNTVTCNVSLSSNPLPAAQTLIRAVLWGSKALLFGVYTCYIYDFESDAWLERKRFKTGVDYFGLTLDDNTLYISGGGICATDANDKDVWTSRDAVRSLHVQDLLSDNKQVEWKHHAKLPVPAMIHLCSLAAMLK